MGSGDKRRLRRQRQRGKQDAEPKGNGPAVLVLGLLVAGAQIGGIWTEELAAALDRLYCTPGYCQTLPQALIGWAVAVVPLLVLLWRRDIAMYVSAFLAGLMGVLLIASDGGWVVPQTFFLVGLAFTPISIGISRLARPGWRAVAVAGQHWLLLAGLILWLA